MSEKEEGSEGGRWKDGERKGRRERAREGGKERQRGDEWEAWGSLEDVEGGGEGTGGRRGVGGV